MKSKRIIICILTIAISVLLSSTDVLAHTLNVRGHEDVGWKEIAEGYHSSSTIIRYKFGPFEPSGIKDATRAGAGMWEGTVTIQEDNINYIGIVWSDYYPDASWAAGFHEPKFDSNGHLTSWEIVVNKRYTVRESTLAHEFGHAIGLTDLFASKNTNKLMYGYRPGRTATGPTDFDKWGAKVITGVYSLHTWEYKYYSFNSSGNIHVKYCTSCQGIYDSASNPGPCTYNSSNVCTLCGIPKGVQPYSFIVQTPAKEAR